MCGVRVFVCVHVYACDACDVCVMFVSMRTNVNPFANN